MDHFSAFICCKTIYHDPIVYWMLFHESVGESTGRSLESPAAEVEAGRTRPKQFLEEHRQCLECSRRGQGGALSGVDSMYSRGYVGIPPENTCGADPSGTRPSTSATSSSPSVPFALLALPGSCFASSSIRYNLGLVPDTVQVSSVSPFVPSLSPSLFVMLVLGSEFSRGSRSSRWVFGNDGLM